MIRPAYVHQQPDNSMNSTESSFGSLPDECLLRIFKKLDYKSLATLAVVCKKIRRLIKENIFAKWCRLDCETANDIDVVNALITVKRIILIDFVTQRRADFPLKWNFSKRAGYVR